MVLVFFGCPWMCLENGGTWEERGAELLGCRLAANAAGAETGLGPCLSKWCRRGPLVREGLPEGPVRSLSGPLVGIRR